MHLTVVLQMITNTTLRCMHSNRLRGVPFGFFFFTNQHIFLISHTKMQINKLFLSLIPLACLFGVALAAPASGIQARDVKEIQARDVGQIQARDVGDALGGDGVLDDGLLDDDLFDDGLLDDGLLDDGLLK
ncbi:hypothetical protein MBANPS3_005854 [Mucor bainieri]